MKNQTPFLLVLLLFFAIQSNAPVFSGTSNQEEEDKERKHLIYLELGGHSFIYSIGYGYRFHKKWELTAGFGYLNFNIGEPYDDLNGMDYFKMASIPIVLRRYYGENRHKFEWNAGIQFLRLDTDLFSYIEPGNWGTWYLSPGAGIGYRYNRTRFVFVASLNASYVNNFFADRDIFILGGLRFGYLF